MKTLNPKQSAKFTITVATPGVDSPAVVPNTATVSSTLADMLTGNNSVTVPTTINPPYADLSLTAAATPNPVAHGGVLTYKFTIKNIGPQAATGISFHIAYTSAVTLPSKPPAGCHYEGNEVICDNLGTLAKGATKIVTVVVKAASGGGVEMPANAEVESLVADPDTDNNTASVTPVTKPS
jgi:hypothetical protein